MKYPLILIALVVLVAGCASTPTPAPTLAPTAVPPTEVPKPTATPTSTRLPPSPTLKPTATPVPPTNTPIPRTPTATVTSTRRPVTPTPTSTPLPTNTVVVLKFEAPQSLEPHSGDTRTSSTDLLLSWQPVGSLGPNECYLVTVRVTNTADGEYGEQSFVAENTCGDPGSAPVTFTLHKRAPAPDYAGLVAIASAKSPTSNYRVTWNVMVIQNNGVDPNKPDPSQYIPLSPPSSTLEFSLLA